MPEDVGRNGRPLTDSVERRHAEVHRAWQANPTPETERALARAADALRRARRSQHAGEGVTNAELREVFADDAPDDVEGS